MDVRAPSPPARPIRKSICRRMRLHGCRFSENGHKRTGRFHIRPCRAQCAEGGKSSRARRLQSLKRGRSAMLRKGAGAECRFQNRIAAREFRTFRYVVFLGVGLHGIQDHSGNRLQGFLMSERVKKENGRLAAQSLLLCCSSLSAAHCLHSFPQRARFCVPCVCAAFPEMRLSAARLSAVESCEEKDLPQR